MREIKFRIWDNTFKEWYVSGVSLWELFNLSEDALFREIEWSHLAQRLVFLQYTGLKDIEGKEVYEGDIIEYNPIDSTAIKRAEVKYNKMIGQFEPLPKIFGKCKILGNVYENKNLLK